MKNHSTNNIQIESNQNKVTNKIYINKIQVKDRNHLNNNLNNN